MDQLRLIIKLLGMPSDKEMECVEHEKAKEYIRSKFGQFKVRLFTFHPHERVLFERVCAPE